jgi:hypothetical protein
VKDIGCGSRDERPVLLRVVEPDYFLLSRRGATANSTLAACRRESR